MEKEVKPYYEDDYQSLDEVDTVDLLEMKEGALNDLNESERTIHRINQILASRAIYATLDAKAANDIFEAIKELKLKTIEDWYYDLIDDTEETMDLMKETIAERKYNA